MKIQDHVIYSIDAFERREKEHSLLHACIAIDATARKLFDKPQATKQDYKNCVRQYYWLIQYFLPGIDYTKTKFPHILVDPNNKKIATDIDLADIIYHYRCSNAHGNETSKNYQLLPSVPNTFECILKLGEGVFQISEKIVWALLAVSVFSKANSSLQSEGDYLLFCSNNNFSIKDYWGKEQEVETILTQHPMISVELKGLDGLM